jgi:hypothetical protein
MLEASPPIHGAGLSLQEDNALTTDEKKAVILDFYKTMELAQKSIEAGLDAWLDGSGMESFDDIMLNMADLMVKLLRFRLHTG